MDFDTSAPAEAHGGSSLDSDALFEQYSGELSDMQMTDEQRRELLVNIWSIMKMFVEMGFTPDICGYLGAIADEPAQPDSAALEFAKASNKEPGEERDQ